VAGLAGEGVGKDEGLTVARFVLTDGVGRCSAAACGGGRRCLQLELLLPWRGGASGGVQQHGEVVWGRVELLGRLAGGGRVGISELAAGHQWQTTASACAWAASSLNSRPAPCLHDEGTRPP
jgi:hypothetical protein